MTTTLKSVEELLGRAKRKADLLLTPRHQVTVSRVIRMMDDPLDEVEADSVNDILTALCYVAGDFYLWRMDDVACEQAVCIAMYVLGSYGTMDEDIAEGVCESMAFLAHVMLTETLLGQELSAETRARLTQIANTDKNWAEKTAAA